MRGEEQTRGDSSRFGHKQQKKVASYCTVFTPTPHNLTPPPRQRRPLLAMKMKMVMTWYTNKGHGHGILQQLKQGQAGNPYPSQTILKLSGAAACCVKLSPMLCYVMLCYLIYRTGRTEEQHPLHGLLGDALVVQVGEP